MRECQVCYCRIIRWKNVKGNRVTVSPGHCQSHISGDVSWVSRDWATRFIWGPKLLHSCFVQCLLHDEGFGELENRRKKRWVPRSLTTEHTRQRKAICSELMERFDAEGEACSSRIVTVTKPGLTTMSRRRKGSQWSGIIRNHQEKRSSRQLLPPERSWSPSFGTPMELFWWRWWPEVRKSIRTRTSKPSKKWNSVTGEFGLTGIRQTCWFSTTMPAITQVYEPRWQSPNLVGLCSPIPPTVLIWRRQIFIFLGHWRMHCVGQGLKTTRAWFVRYGHGYVNRKRASTGKACMPLFRAGVRP